MTARPQTRQHGHLRARFNLKNADGVGPLNHRVGAGIVLGNLRHVPVNSAVLAQKIQGSVHSCQHAESEHVDFHEAESIDVVFIPLNHVAILHAGRLYWNDIDDRLMRDDKSTSVNAEMARKSFNFVGHL